MLLYIIYFCIALFLIRTIWKKCKVDKVNEPPELSKKIPLLGHCLSLLGDSLHCWNVAKWCSKECLEKGGVVTMSIGPRKIYFVADPDDCATVANQCIEKVKYYNFSRPWLGEGLFTASAKVWKKNRKLLTPSFTPQVINGFLGVFNDQARSLVKELENLVDKGKFDQFSYLCSNGLVTTIVTVLGEQNYVKDSFTYEYLHSVQEIQNIFTNRFQKFWLHSDFIYNRTRYKKRQDELLKILHNISDNVREILQKRKSEIAARNKIGGENQHKGKFKPFLDRLLELALEDNLLTDQEVRYEVDSIIVAAHDTSAYALAIILTMLGSYTEVQEKAFREIQEVWGDLDRDLNKDDVHKLVYLEAVVKETARLYPAAPIIARHSEVEVKLKNYTIPKDTDIALCFLSVHQHPAWGPDAAKFKPERWLDPAALPGNPNTFAGFSIGKRSCIGKAFALSSMKVLLAHLIRRYKITADESKMRLKIEVVLKPAYGHEIALELRKSK